MKIGIFGINGKMGSLLADEILKDDSLILLWGIDPVNYNSYKDVPVYSSLETATVPDCIIDFSHHTHIKVILDYAKKNKCPLVIATTAHDDEEVALIKEASKDIAVFYSANLSYGIQVVIDTLKHITNKLAIYDIEVEEVHHRDKYDAPSGTAIKILEAINSELLPARNIINGHSKKRSRNEIGIHALRGGSVVGTHRVLFLGDDEVIEIKHEALSKKVFTSGAIKAAKYIINQVPGLYGMENLTNGRMKG